MFIEGVGSRQFSALFLLLLSLKYGDNNEVVDLRVALNDVSVVPEQQLKNGHEEDEDRLEFEEPHPQARQEFERRRLKEVAEDQAKDDD